MFCSGSPNPDPSRKIAAREIPNKTRSEIAFLDNICYNSLIFTPEGTAIGIQNLSYLVNFLQVNLKHISVILSG